MRNNKIHNCFVFSTHETVFPFSMNIRLHDASVRLYSYNRILFLEEPKNEWRLRETSPVLIVKGNLHRIVPVPIPSLYLRFFIESLTRSIRIFTSKKACGTRENHFKRSNPLKTQNISKNLKPIHVTNQFIGVCYDG